MPFKSLRQFFKKKHFVLIVISPFTSLNIHAQLNTSEEIVNSLLPKIELALEETPNGLAHRSIIEMVDVACAKQDSLKLDVLERVMYKFEAHFDLLAATRIGELIVVEAKKRIDEESEANARFNLHRYYNALGKGKESTEHIEIALVLYTKLNNHYKVLFCKVYMLLDSRTYRSDEEILIELNGLLQWCEENNDLDGQNILNRHLVSIYLANNNLIQAEKSIAALELIIKQNSNGEIKGTSTLRTSLYRADLELAKEDTVKAIYHYKRTLKLSIEEPDLWVEIHVMQALASIFISSGEYETAKNYLAQTRKKALNSNALDLISLNFLLESHLAENEKRFEDAYRYINKHYYYTNLLNERGKGFDLKNHYLTLEKQQLVSEQKQKELEIAIHKNQVKYTSALMLFALVIALMFFIAFRKHRKGNQTLALQNETITQQALKLKEADLAKSQFFANISHELRTPLTLLTSPVKTLLEEEDLTERQYKLLDIANKSGKQLETLINEILDLRKLENGKMKPNLKPTELSSFCLNYVSQFESLARQKEIIFSYKFENELFASIDREKWRQVMLNLLSNAFKFTPTGGKIEVSLKLVSSTIEFIVDDTGEGIDAEELPRIFELYFQSDKTSYGSAGGTGIGLTLCYEYANLLGGTLDVESVLGVGSSFAFKVPFLQADHIEDSSENDFNSSEDVVYKSNVINQKKLLSRLLPTILIVEDNRALQDYISLIMSENYNVLMASHGKEALAVISTTQQIDLIVSDLMMPTMDGYGLIAELKKSKQTSSIPLILLTARTEIETKLKALRFGVDDYLTKPFDERELTARIQNLLNTQKSRKAELNLEVDIGPMVSRDKSSEWLDRFEAYVRMHLNDPSLSIPTIAAEFAMSESSLLRKVKSLIGFTPIKYIQEIRLDFARKLLEEKTYSSIKEIAYKSGFKDTSTFSRNYSKRFGKLPSDYL